MGASRKTVKVSSDFLRIEKELDLKRIDLFGEKYNTDVLPAKYFVQLYGELFNTYTFHAKIQTEDFLKQLQKNYGLSEENFVYKYLDADDVNLNKTDYSSSEFLIHLKEKMLLYVGNENFKIWYSRETPFSEIRQVLDIVESFMEKISYNKKFFMVADTENNEYGFELQQFDIGNIHIDLESHYNDDFIPVHNIIYNFLTLESQNGIVLLHGKFGTGKTSYLRYLISNINKRVIFLPLDLIEIISSPGFLPFISQYKDSVLILEDCEELLRPRDVNTYKQGGIANLLNLGDGLLADALNIKIICTFNAELKLIDKAILRKGRLLARYEFNELDMEKAKKLAKKLNITQEITESITLAELYNLSSQDFNFNRNSDYRKLGF